MKHIDDRWQGGDQVNSLRIWAHQPGGSVIIADFSVSKSLRYEIQKANAERAKLAVNFCSGVSNAEISRLEGMGIAFGDILTRMRMLRSLVSDDKLGDQAKLILSAVDRVIGGL